LALDWLKPGTKTRPSAPPAADVPFAAHTTYRPEGSDGWYDPVILGTETVAALASSPSVVRQVTGLLEVLSPDAYTTYLLSYYHAGLDRFGDNWRYADITTVLLAVSRLIRPETYLEIGVRRGRSMAMVVHESPACDIAGFDMWIQDYGGMENPGPDFVRAEMGRAGHTGVLELVVGNSHDTVPRYLAERPDAYFDLVTVDGDHSESGAEADLRTVMPRVKRGGALVFDDISHPQHPELAGVWERVVRRDPRFNCWEFTGLGYGVGVAIRSAA
jgi:hypothetical protein